MIRLSRPFKTPVGQPMWAAMPSSAPPSLPTALPGVAAETSPETLSSLGARLHSQAVTFPFAPCTLDTPGCGLQTLLQRRMQAACRRAGDCTNICPYIVSCTVSVGEHALSIVILLAQSGTLPTATLPRL